ncbi:MAG: DJ-1/PfpI family protein [Treponema sp.]|jgi:4-methyl-5(b-hydroxyethyl)-thiazole monophosphate biosynthesis|nr:DJ-1/PfpI family protein [Treponema sp.]
MPKKVVVFLADGFEEVEAVTPIDYLRRAGLEVHIAAVGKNRLVTGAHGLPVTAGLTLGELVKKGAGPWDAVLLPGGMPGASNIAASKEAGAFIKEMAAAGKWVTAICASPAVVLAPLGLLAGKRFTCYPGMEKQVRDTTARWSADKVVVDGNTITSRGAGTAAYWAVEIIGRLLSPAEGKKVAQAVLLENF